MCATCGCGRPETRFSLKPPPKRIDVERVILEGNARVAAQNRAVLADRRIIAVNLMSSPGAGKTTLLERTLADLRGELTFGVIEGDQETDLDAARIRKTGVPAIQVNTGTGCHLDARMLMDALPGLDLAEGGVIFVENVGNLVCPALFDLGERAKVVIISVPEGDEKPLKYPHMFRVADLVVLNKIDLLPYVPFDVERFRANLASINPRARLLSVSALRGEGLGEWYSWIRTHRSAVEAHP